LPESLPPERRRAIEWEAGQSVGIAACCDGEPQSPSSWRSPGAASGSRWGALQSTFVLANEARFRLGHTA